ncbi:hypothetical protein PR048_023980 [Dryococelus australis]|uniref:PiggyBac transposable element-derived protein domain-containing protein n=1 Tax=Dryococelus australis TaxID=614101 RepID=A0ABQ9GVL3_9NEOP|nr:hypothetical protein PR048_023980 [Dryococelus australis]
MEQCSGGLVNYSSSDAKMADYKWFSEHEVKSKYSSRGQLMLDLVRKHEAYVPPSHYGSEDEKITELEEENVDTCSVSSDPPPISTSLNEILDEIAFNIDPAGNTHQSVPAKPINHTQCSRRRETRNTTTKQIVKLPTQIKKRKESLPITKSKKYKSSNVTFDFQDNEFYSIVSMPEDNFEIPQSVLSDIDYFNKFFYPDLVELIVMATNQYSVQVSGKLIQTTDAEVTDCLAMELLRSIIIVPAYIDYWSKSLRIEKIASIMPLKRGCQIDEGNRIPKRGSSCEKADEKKVYLVRWIDNKEVLLATDFVGRNPQSRDTPYSKEEQKKIDISCPNTVKGYNTHMGGINLTDMLIVHGNVLPDDRYMCSKCLDFEASAWTDDNTDPERIQACNG